jgi:hypothetical protein
LKEYHFDIEDAKKYGVDEAIVLYNIRFWCEKNEANEKHYHEDENGVGRYWTYNSKRAFTVIFPFWNEQKLRRILDSLRKQGAIITGNFNKNSYDHTLWYAINDNSIGQIRPIKRPEATDQTVEDDRPIPYINTDRKPDEESDSSFLENEDEVEKLIYTEYEKEFAFPIPSSKYDIVGKIAEKAIGNGISITGEMVRTAIKDSREYATNSKSRMNPGLFLKTLSDMILKPPDTLTPLAKKALEMGRIKR